MIRIDGISYQEHRVVFALAKGRDPGTMQIDHKEGVSSNRPRHLREATCQQNLRRRTRLGSNNTSGVLGVYWHNGAQKWAAGVKVGQRDVYLGLFTDIEAAARVRRAAEKKHFGRFAPKMILKTTRRRST
jgi:hypothetical protein